MSIGPRDRGLTLAETLVASGVMLVLMVATLSIYFQARAAQQKTDVHSDAFRTVALAHEKITETLRGSRVLQPSYDPQNLAPTEVLALQPPQLTDEQLPRVNADGSLVRSAESELWVSEGKLTRREGTTEQVVLALGAGGQVEFQRLATDLLRVRVRAQAGETIYESYSEHYLGNQL
ncbi:MAG: hypothetical protein AB7S38_40140 [Vulcanimicrobiota bacterium]